MTEALAIRDDEPNELAPISPREVIRAANEQANALAEVIESKKLYVNIGGKKYDKCEGWTTLAILRGYAPSEESVVEVDGVYTATVVLHRIRDGMVLTRASAECGSPDEPMWANRPRYARRSMAITRATSKACRVAFSWALALAGR